MRLPLVALSLLAIGVSALPIHAEKHALLIGINDYQYARDLKGSVNDITQVKALLIKDLAFDESRIQTLLDSQATKANILAALAGLAGRTKAGDSILWYYSGHGFMMLDEDGDEALEDPTDMYDEVLVPYDARPWPKERATDPNPTMLSDDEIAKALSNLVGRKVIVIFDSCHSGSGTRAINDTDNRSLYENWVPPAAPKTKAIHTSREMLDLSGPMVFISAASPLQTASDLGEFEGRRHGAFTASLLRSIRESGDGWQKTASWDGLFQRARKDMLDHGFASQTPSIRALEGLSKRSVETFFTPPVASEIADVQGSEHAFEVQLESNKYRFTEGDLLELYVQSARDGYLYVFDVDSEQKVTQLFPNEHQRQNRIRRGERRTLPEREEHFQYPAGPPFGRSTEIAIVTTQPWVEADRLQLPANLRPLAENQKTGLRDQLRRLQDAAASRNSDPGWSSQKLVVEIVPKGYRPPEEIAEEIAPTAPAGPVAAVGAVYDRLSLDDTKLTPEDQADLQTRRPELFAKLKSLAERYSPVFWQDVSGSYDGPFRPWKDFFVRYDFDETQTGPNWPEPPRFQDEQKRERNHYLDDLLTPSTKYQLEPVKETPGVITVRNKTTGETTRLDLRPHVYWTVLTTPTHYFFHYAAFHAEDWKGMMGHPGDLEGCTIVVDRKTEKMVAGFALAHDDVEIVRSLDEQPENNIEVMVDPGAESRGLFDEDDGRPIDGALSMEAGRDGEPAPKEHQEIYVETKGHGQHGGSSIKKSHYVIYANYFDNSTFSAPSFDKEKYPLADKFDQVVSKHRYELVYFGSSPSQQHTFWGEYKDLKRFSGGVNPPWDWRDNLFFKTGWWKDPRRVKKIGDGQYLINPYLNYRGK